MRHSVACVRASVSRGHRSTVIPRCRPPYLASPRGCWHSAGCGAPRAPTVHALLIAITDTVAARGHRPRQEHACCCCTAANTGKACSAGTAGAARVARVAAAVTRHAQADPVARAHLLFVKTRGVTVGVVASCESVGVCRTQVVGALCPS